MLRYRYCYQQQQQQQQHNVHRLADNTLTAITLQASLYSAPSLWPVPTIEEAVCVGASGAADRVRNHFARGFGSTSITTCRWTGRFG